MHLTEHVTDVQLNEYLDHELTPEARAQIESHISTCDECATRLTALQSLFAEIESLPDLEWTPDIAARIVSTRTLSVPQVPRWFTLTATLQAALALVAMIVAAPNLSTYLTPVMQTYSLPSFQDVSIELQMNFVMWIRLIRSFQFPTFSTGFFTLPEELSTTTLSFSLIGIFIVWVIGNWWLFRKRPNSLA